MAPECTYIYPDGRKCRRIPRRGEVLCRDHRRLVSARPPSDEEAFNQQMTLVCEQLSALHLDQVLEDLSESLNVIYPFVESLASSVERTAYTRATIACTIAIDCVLAGPGVLARMLPNATPQQIRFLIDNLRNARPPLPGDVAKAADPATPSRTA